MAGRAAAGVGVLFTREFSAAGDKLSRQLGATVARLIGGMHQRAVHARGRAGASSERVGGDLGRDSPAPAPR